MLCMPEGHPRCQDASYRLNGVDPWSWRGGLTGWTLDDGLGCWDVLLAFGPLLVSTLSPRLTAAFSIDERFVRDDWDAMEVTGLIFGMFIDGT